ncbi:ubiquitin-associated domain-containing protein 1 isoform X1 [Lethenteron reissneri]|uniref:ubiquitin-associated domain-containing protein 1 isoform X1 n=1 Tax=Lethenteron reissneri TaxID=7753 RepID=UPI002AB6DF93|nr:ubiquitin-associated domain-containing protein 1 isoform X1 [Lethenteron reissneri]
MFVEEEKIFAAQALLLRLTVLAADGAEWRGEAAEAAPLRELKERALPQCVPGAAEDPKAASHYKLVHVGSVRSLADSRTAAQEGLQDQDVLLLIRRRPPPPLPKMTDVASEEKRKAEQKAPDRDAIVQATAGVRARNASRTTTAPPNIRDFHTDLRKILVSLIDVAQKLLALNPEAVDLFRTANAMLDEDVEAERPPEVEGALTQLLEMGFPEGRASVALHSNDMSVTRAMEWLIEHEHDSTAATSTATTSTTTTIATSTTTAPAITGPAAATASWLPRPPAAPPATSPAAPRSPRGGAQGEVATPDDLTEVFRRIRRRREFRPDPMALAALLEMGFEEKDVVEALRVNGNNQEAACEWLLGERAGAASEGGEGGLSPGSPLLQAILENPVVQLGLTRPKNLLAFEDMLENPVNSAQWMNDPETGPVMLQISRIFQTLNRM